MRGFDRRGGGAETSSHPFRSLFDLMLVLAFLFAGAFALSRNASKEGKEKVDASPLKPELLILHNVDSRRLKGQSFKPINNLSELPSNDPCQILLSDKSHITRDEQSQLETHRKDLWNTNQSVIEQKLRADSIERTVSDKELTFASASATPINPEQGQSLLDDAYQRYRQGYTHIRVEGHTDNIEIHTEQFPSNWHLSAARAIWLASKMVDDLAHRGVVVGRDIQIEAIGYGDKHPIADNSTKLGQDRNRRIEIRYER